MILKVFIFTACITQATFKSEVIVNNKKLKEPKILIITNNTNTGEIYQFKTTKVCKHSLEVLK